MKSEEITINIKNVTKAFGDFKAIDNVSLEIPKGSFTTLLGPSGCGKTTLMRLIAGFYEPDGGNIYIEGKKVNGLPAYKRNTPLVFQEYALFPHMTVFENISYGLKLRKESRTEIEKKVASMLEMFNLSGMENRFPKQLSGGQQQRVAFARALVTGQKILLLDEPLSNLDAKLRVEVRNELRAIQQRLGITAVFVTHDQDEALSMSDMIAVLDKGRICQVGTPWEVYFKPINKFVANFVGVANFITCEVLDIEEDITVKYEEFIIKLDKSNYSVSKGEMINLVIRPECISLTNDDNTLSETDRVNGLGWNIMNGEIITSSFLGHMIRYWVKVGDREFTVDDSNPSLNGRLQGKVSIEFDKNKIHILPSV
jgi:ABC-type Fe3+/spermidine/putrescine transport system ATPase subunit